ncbi:hypothetical protein BGZ74_005854 [Mortierella antarctica]|nr:hypothetical protein BGZ74_005854 [Mortierella antarctica]
MFGDKGLEGKARDLRVRQRHHRLEYHPGTHNQDYGLIPYVADNATVPQLMSGVAAVQSRGEDVMLAKLDKELGSKTKRGCRSHHSSYDGIDIKVVDIAEVYTHLREPRQMRRMGITDLKGSCVSLDYASACKDPKNYFFYDEFYATTVVHQQVAKAVLDALDA